LGGIKTLKPFPMARLPYLKPYDPQFLGNNFSVPYPVPRCTGNLYESGRIIDYIHYSLVLHQDRKTAIFTAHNIDISQKKSVPRTGWDLDPRIPASVQTGPGVYTNNPWDRGHLVRRAAVAWGSSAEAKDASDSTFYYSNAALQHARFNQDEWLNLEDWVLQKAGGASSKLCVFTGPIYTTIDQFERSHRIPSAFFKIIVLLDPTANGEDLSALGFVMKQNEMWDNWNGADMLDLHTYEVGIQEIGRYTGLDFGQIGLVDEFEWRRPNFRDRSRMAPVRIAGPEDISFNGDRRRKRGIRALTIGPSEKYQLNTVRAIQKPEASKKSSCGCDEEVSLETKVEAISKQVKVLSELLENLLQEEGNNSEEVKRTTRLAVRQRYQKIVGGQMTQMYDFPHCACIGDDDDWFCSGVLISPTIVLTAAHCAPGIKKVYLGGRSILLSDSVGEVIEVEREIIHPDYSAHQIPSHDIAILILKTPAQSTPISIASDQELETEDNTRLVGFGFDHPTQPVGFGTKREVDVPISNLTGLNPSDIARIEENHGFDNRYEFHAGRKELGRDSCFGDSGGPSYIDVNGDFKLIGLTSRAAFSVAEPCGHGGIYTRVTPYLPWINTVTGQDNEVPLQPNTPATGENISPSGIYIAAALPNPIGGDQGNEWVELGNASPGDIPLNKFYIADKQGGKLNLSGVLSANNKLKILIPKSSAVKLGNNGDEIILGYEDQILHKVGYSSAGSGEIKSFEVPAPPSQPDDNDNPQPPNNGSFPEADPC
jgi:endonuclease G